METNCNRILVLSLFLFTQFMFAQTQKVKGVVTDQDNMPLPGASIVVKGTAIGTQTDFDGNYDIEVSIGDVLVLENWIISR